MTAAGVRIGVARRRVRQGGAQRAAALRALGARLALFALVAALLMLQLRLWNGDGGVRELARLGRMIAVQQQENAALRERNEALDAEVRDLKEGAAAVEERARRDLSMIRRDETFFQSVER